MLNDFAYELGKEAARAYTLPPSRSRSLPLTQKKPKQQQQALTTPATNRQEPYRYGQGKRTKRPVNVEN